MATAAQLALFEPEQSPTIERGVHLVAPQRVACGDLWQLGRHRLLCGDSTDAAETARLFGGARIDACITDPPYGVNWDTDYRRLVPRQRTHLNGTTPRLHHRASIRGDAQPFDPRPLLQYRKVVLWGANCYASRLPIGTLLVWDKRHKNGSAILADAEVAWMKGGHGVYIFAHTWQGVCRATPREPILHPTQKPTPLMEWCIEKAKAGNAVYDPYCGSGPVLLACERTGRACYAAEIEPTYADIILKRWEQATGQQATLLDRLERVA